MMNSVFLLDPLLPLLFMQVSQSEASHSSCIKLYASQQEELDTVKKAGYTFCFDTIFKEHA